MKTKLISLLFAAVTVRADFNLDSVVASAKADTKNAPAIVAKAAVDNPNFAIQLVSAAVKALPDQAVGITQAVLNALPNRAIEVVRAVIEAQPKLAAEIVAAVLREKPELAGQIAAIPGLPTDVQQVLVAPPGPAIPVFPPQPVTPEIVSPSS